MTGLSDGKYFLERTRLCELGEIERGRHIRWTKSPDLLRDRSAFGELDLIKAVVLDELTAKLKPKAARVVWRQVEREIGHPGSRLEIVVGYATLSARVVRSDADLDQSLPRGESVIIIDLQPRIERARKRLAEFRKLLLRPAHHAGAPRSDGAGDSIEELESAEDHQSRP